MTNSQMASMSLIGPPPRSGSGPGTKVPLEPAGRAYPRSMVLRAAAITGCLLACLPATASADARPTPPTSVALERATPEVAAPALREAPAVARRLFPETRLVTVYGAPQLGATIVGKRSPSGAAGEAVRLATRYAEVDPRPAQAGIDLIATVATADPGPSGLYRTRQDPDLIATYLDAARAAGGRLVLDIQPGRAKPIAEVRALEEWLLQPDVDVAIDPEWNVGRRGVPGATTGKISARQIDRVSAYVARLVRENGLPQKTLVVHQFREGSVQGRGQVDQRGEEVAVTLNFDGIGTPAAKISGYRALSRPGLFNGFSVFVSRDSNVMGFRRIAALQPAADYVMYQ